MRASRGTTAPGAQGPDAGDYREHVGRGRPPNREYRIACRLEDGALTGFFNISEIVRGNFHNAFLGYGGVAEFAARAT